MAAKTPSQKAAEEFKKWHWGLEHVNVVDVEDPDLPDELIECGRLAEIRVRIPSSDVKANRSSRKDTQITLTQAESERSHLAFDPAHPSERLYTVLPADVLRKMKTTYYDLNPFAEQKLGVIAKFTGGRHGTERDYPSVMVKPIGICSAVVYATEKTGDGFSYYIHRLGEETGVRPCLCIDKKGRLWFAGGAYTSPTPGITD